jgi:hypothetical protein
MNQGFDHHNDAVSIGFEKNQPAKNANLHATNVCPANGRRGKLVQNQTIKALLGTSLRSFREVEHFYCSTEDCPVVYFTADGTQTFTIDELREKVYHKEKENPVVPVCYCFQHSVGALMNSSNDQQQAIISDIKQGIAAGQCACDLRNPQGSCCLGNAVKLVKQLDSKL